RVVLLPGMDGGKSLLGSFRAHLPAGLTSEVFAYPPDEVNDYKALERILRERLAALDAPVSLVAESFSGPIGIRVAADPPPNVGALVLVATFATSLWPAWWRHVVHPSFFIAPPPPVFVRRYFVGANAPDE